jgi:hypothetical protein
MRRSTLTWLAMAGAVCALAPAAHATVVTEVKLPAMTDDADLIVRGVVEKRRTMDEGGRLFTYTTVRVTEVHKGEIPASGQIVVRTVGGERGLVISRVIGAPQFALGEEVFLFLESATPWHQRVIGMSQGKFDIVKDPLSGKERLVRELGGLAFVGWDKDGKMTIQPADALDPVPANYDEIVKVVRRQVALSRVEHTAFDAAKAISPLMAFASPKEVR